MASYNLVNIDSSNGMLHDGTKPLPESSITLSLGGSCGIHLRIIFLKMLKTPVTEMCLNITPTPASGQ